MSTNSRVGKQYPVTGWLSFAKQYGSGNHTKTYLVPPIDFDIYGHTSIRSGRFKIYSNPESGESHWLKPQSKSINEVLERIQKEHPNKPIVIV